MNGRVIAQEGSLVGSVKMDGILVGTIKSDGTLVGTIKTDGLLVGSLSISVDYEDYTGSYDITPKVDEQVMRTKDSHMTDDVTIKAIPYYNVGNTSGGSTVYIGNKLDD